MDIQTYLRINHVTQDTLAKRLGVSRGTVRQLMHGVIQMSGDWAYRIAVATNNEVTRADLRPDLFISEEEFVEMLAQRKANEQG